MIADRGNYTQGSISAGGIEWPAPQDAEHIVGWLIHIMNPTNADLPQECRCRQ
jgi:hypothetical protein